MLKYPLSTPLAPMKDMRKTLGKIKAFLPQEPKGRASYPPVPPPVGAGHLPEEYYMEVDKYRYRKHRGVNLGELLTYFSLF